MAHRPMEVMAQKPLLQQSYEVNKQNIITPISQCLSIFVLIPSVIALDVGMISTCNNDNMVYTMDINPQTFLIVAGSVGIGWFGWVFLTLCCSCFWCSTQPYKRYKCIQFCISKITYPMIIFFITWTVIGLYIYEEAMPQCQDDDIGKMILAWCIINCVWIGVLVCSIFCRSCCCR